LGVLGAGAALTIAGVEIPQLIGSSDENSPDNNPIKQPDAKDVPGIFSFSAEKLPGEVDEIVLHDAVPSQMVIRRGASINAVGVVVDDAGRKIVCEVEDPLRKGQDGRNETFTCILTDTVAEDQRKPGEIVFSDIVASNNGTYSTENEAVTSNGKTKKLLQLSGEEADDYRKKSGVFFVDRDPLKFEHPLLEDPVIPASDIDGEIHQAEDKRVLIKDASGQDVARARYFPWRKEWRWVKDPESVSDYTIREFADAKGLVFGFFDGDFRGNPGSLQDPEMVDLIEKTSNQLVSGGFDVKETYSRFGVDGWRRVLSNWDSIKSELDSGRVPDFPYRWTTSDAMVNLAETTGMKIRAQHLFYGVDIPQSIIDGNFSNDQLKKIAEFLVKTRVNKYKGKIAEWDVADEPAGDLVGGGGNNRKYWYDHLGQGILDDVARWTKTLDPDAKLVMVEDHVIEGTTMPNAINFFKQISGKFWELATHFKEAGVPIDKIGIENNLWIYRAPSKEQIAAVLKRVQDLGFGLASTEATVGSYQEEGFYKEMTTNNPVANPDELQAKVFADLASAYIEAGGDFALGGVTDATVWTAVKSPKGRSAIFDADRKPKPSFFALRDIYKSA